MTARHRTRSTEKEASNLVGFNIGILSFGLIGLKIYVRSKTNA